MKAQTTITTIVALAAAALSTNPVMASAQTSQAADKGNVTVNGWVIPIGHQGPGIGSPKSAPFIHYDAAPAALPTAVLFHTSTGTPVVAHAGPGAGSTKTPWIK